MRSSMELLLNLLSLVILQHGNCLYLDVSPTINIPQGHLRGQKVISPNRSPYYRFLGIPYAKPPVGELRFKAPVPPEPWHRTRDMLNEGSICTQPNATYTGSLGDEDCLFLNIYTPQLPNSLSLLPVMVWIHGGGFIMGSGNALNQGPEYLVDRRIVYVSINYRLGVLGFLSTEDDAAPGNAGMKDQVQALRWIQKNIAAFGGDPKKVTIFGESAGGTSAHYHMLSPMSKGLFRAAIADSGSAARPISIAHKPRIHAFEVSNALGYSGNSSHELVDLFRTIRADILTSTAYNVVPEWERYRLQKTFRHAPSVEPVLSGETPFITDNPLCLMEQGKIHNLPLFIGVNSDEGINILLAGGVTQNFGRLREIDLNFARVFGPEVWNCYEGSCYDTLIPKIRAFYFGDRPLDNSTLPNFIDLNTDARYAEGIYRAVRMISARNTSPVFFYEFTYDGGLNYMKHRNPEIQKFPGASHVDELGYIFDIGVHVDEESLDANVRRKMVTLWTNFVKTGNPTPKVSQEIPAWLPYTNSSRYYLDIGSKLKLKTDYNKKRMDFWEDLYTSDEQ